MTRVDDNGSNVLLGRWLRSVLGSRDMHAVVEVLISFSIGSLGDEISVADSNWSLDSVVNVVLVGIDGFKDFEVSDVLLPGRSKLWVAKHLPDFTGWDVNFGIGLYNGNSRGFLFNC